MNYTRPPNNFYIFKLHKNIQFISMNTLAGKKKERKKESAGEGTNNERGNRQLGGTCSFRATSSRCHVSHPHGWRIFTLRQLPNSAPRVLSLHEFCGSKWWRRIFCAIDCQENIKKSCVAKTTTEKWFVLKYLHFNNLFLNVPQIGQKATPDPKSSQSDRNYKGFFVLGLSL